MEFGEKIKSLRKAKGMTLEQVGDLVGVGKSTVRKWESGDIKNMRRDKIAGLASALGTTPAYLMGWGVHTDDWTNHFRDRLSFILGQYDQADFSAASVDFCRLASVADGAYPLSLAEACAIADELGQSLDDMVGFKEEPAPDEESGFSRDDMEILNLLVSLPDEKRREAVNYLRYLSEQTES